MNFTLDDIWSDIQALEKGVTLLQPFPNKEDKEALLFRIRYSLLYRSPCYRDLPRAQLKERIFLFLSKFAIPQVDIPIEKLPNPAWAHLYLSDHELHDLPSKNFFCYQGPLVKDENGDPDMTGKFKETSRSYAVIYSDPMMGVSVGTVRNSSIYKNESIS